MCVCVCRCVCVSMYVNMCMCECVCESVCVSVCVSICEYEYVCVCDLIFFFFVTYCKVLSPKKQGFFLSFFDPIHLYYSILLPNRIKPVLEHH